MKTNSTISKNEKKHKMITILQYIIILALIIFIFYFSYQKFILHKRYVPFFSHNFFIILSGSMEPTIKTKDLIVTSPKDNYEKNDIIAFHSGNSVTVHRIIDIQNNNSELSYITKGDANNTVDSEELKYDDIIGIYKFTIPILGSMIIFFCSYPIFLILLVTALILIYFIIKLLKNSNRNG